ncbi:prepilin-type N-terminal cleavage/methylation domain-containing protein [Desulfoluna spongiiphila]|uniref:prepilin-type N-terminal cleavage/methylation domain-containing protein n=1 Tax=Desulfoluna spongiiphila TaxID=419481 RepID=UPI001258F607|nr:prepilin-type N-terminal cleavage/methylation domain-containing protein [Desulfoluna spongiiphila]VVS94959.1 prokaryotic n-terminal methylation site [Desulfoluna spongiiphila]
MTMQREPQGFTLLEIMVAMAISIILISAAYFFYNYQLQARITQERVTDMQQNLRAAMLLMEDDIRMAGYDPNGTTGAAITVATASQFSFSYSLDGDANGTDDDGDGTVDEADEALLTETISYALFDEGSNGSTDLGRTVDTGSAVAVSENVEAMALTYMLEDGSFTETPTDLTQIVAVRFAILARTRGEEQGFTNNATYSYDPTDTSKVWGPYNDGHRRRLLRHMVRCRNRGI